MNIRDAILQAKKDGLCITRKSMPNSYFYPTNGVGRTIICRENGSFVVPGWEPQLNDLIATDWKISTVKPEKITDSQLERWSADMIENLKKKPNVVISKKGKIKVEPKLAKSNKKESKE